MFRIEDGEVRGEVNGIRVVVDRVVGADGMALVNVRVRNGKVVVVERSAVVRGTRSGVVEIATPERNGDCSIIPE